MHEPRPILKEIAMIRRSRTLIALSIALGVSAVPAVAQHFVPIHGTFTTTAVLVPTPVPGVFALTISSVGHVSHLGPTTGSSVHTVDQTVSPALQFGTNTYIAANGDRLFSTYSGTASPPNVSGVIQFSGTQTFTGGTGRFNGATGSTTVQGQANVFTGIGQFTFSGTISK
jgi:hypothetical protein